MTIPSPRSLSFREKHWERARVYTRAKTSEDFGSLRTSSGIFGNDRVVFKIPGTARIKISRLYLRKSWQVYNSLNSMYSNYNRFSADRMAVSVRTSQEIEN